MARTPTRNPTPPTHIVAALEAAGISPRELANRLEVDPTTVNKWLEDVNPCAPLAWLAILCACDLPRTWKPPTSKPPRAPRAKRRTR